MEFTRRFIFRGNAVAIGGRIVRPNDRVIESTVASSLPVTGGRSQSRSGGSTSDPFVRYGAASTLAEGLFDDTKGAIEASFGRIREDALTTSTVVRAELADLVVGNKPQLVVKHLRAVLHSKSPAVSGEPSVVPPGKEVAVDGVSIDNHRLIVELNCVPFERCDTHSKLLAAADDPAFVKQFGSSLFLAVAAGQPVPPFGRLIAGRHLIYATIVRQIRWDGDPYPNSQIDHNMVTIPDFGRIFFGELLLTGDSRRLTMIRLQLGSPDGGTVAACEVDTNGTWSS